MQRFREVQALWARLRRPAMRVLVGAALMTPAAVLMAGSELDSAEQESGGRLISLFGRDGQAARGPIFGGRFAAALAGEQDDSEPTADAAETVLDEERTLVVASFAREFRIPVKLASQIHKAAVDEEIHPRMAFGLVKAESSFRTAVVSPVGAVGLTQLLPSTARWLSPGTTRRDLMEPQTNLRVGFKYLRHLIEQFEGDEQLALTAYNRGPGTVSKLLARGADPDNGYAEKVLTGNSQRHVSLMNAKFGPKKKASVRKPRRPARSTRRA